MSFTADRLLLFGATGDLAQRMLLPSLFALDADGLLAPDLKIVGTARSSMTDGEYRNFARAALEKYLPADRRGRMAEFLNRLAYQTLDATTLEGYDALAAKSRHACAWPRDLPLDRAEPVRPHHQRPAIGGADGRECADVPRKAARDGSRLQPRDQ